MVRFRAGLVLKVVAILGPVLVIYWRDLLIVAHDAVSSEVMNYILVLPFFMAFALYRKRRMLRAVTPLENTKLIRRTEEIVGLSLCLSAFILYWHGSYTFYPVEYHLLSMPIFLAGAILLIYNWQTLRQLVFPMALFLFLEPLPLRLANIIGFHTSALSSIAAYNLVKLFGLPVTLVTQQTPIIITETVQGSQLPLAIDVACSGLYSLTGFVAFAVFAAFITRGPVWKRAVLFTVGFPMIYGLNILRIAAIVWIGHSFGAGAAMQAFHLLGGSVLIFIATLTLLTVGDKIGRLRIFTPRVSRQPCPLCNDGPMKGESFCLYCGTFLKPQGQNIPRRNAAKIAGVLAISIPLILVQIPPFALARGTAGIDLNTFSPNELTNDILPTIPEWSLEFVYRDTGIEKSMGWDAALAYAYEKPGSKTPYPTVFVLIQIMKNRHTWEGSLYRWPAERGYPTATMLDERDVDILRDPRITGRFLEFMRPGSTVPEAVIYWFEQALFTANDTQVLRYVSISLDTYTEDLTRAGLIEGTNDTEAIQAVLLPMAKSIAEYWQPLKTWTWINVSLGQGAEYILILTIAPCIIALASLYMRLRTDRKRNAELQRNLKIPTEKKVLEAIALTAKENLPTGKAVEAKYREIVGEDIEVKALLEILDEAKKTGLIITDVANREDDPILVWKHRF